MKKLLTFLLSAACCLTAFGFIACDNGDSSSSDSDSTESSTSTSSSDGNEGGGNEGGGNEGGGNQGGGNEGGGNEGGETPDVGEVVEAVWVQTFTEAKFSNFKAELRGFSGEDGGVIYVEKDGNNAKLTSKDASGAIDGEWLVWQDGGVTKYYVKNGNAYEEMGTFNFIMLLGPSIPQAFSLEIAGDYESASFVGDTYTVQKSNTTVNIPAFGDVEYTMPLECNSLTYAVQFKDGNLLSVGGTAITVQGEDTLTYSYSLTLGGAVVTAPDSGNQGGGTVNPNPGEGEGGEEGGGTVTPNPGEGEGGEEGGETPDTGYITEEIWQEQLAIENFENLMVDWVNIGTDSSDPDWTGITHFEYKADGADAYIKQSANGAYQCEIVAYHGSYYIKTSENGKYALTEDDSVADLINDGRSLIEFPLFVFAQQYANVAYDEEHAAYVLQLDSLEATENFTMQDVEVYFYFDEETRTLSGIRMVYSLVESGNTLINKYQIAVALGNAAIEKPEVGTEGGDNGNEGGDNEGNEGGTVTGGQVDERTWESQLAQDNITHFGAWTELTSSGSEEETYYVVNGDEEYLEIYLDETLAGRHLAYTVNGEIVYYTTDYDIAGDGFIEDTAGGAKRSLASQKESFDIIFNLLATQYATAQYMEEDGHSGYVVIVENYAFEMSGVEYTMTEGYFVVMFQEGELYRIGGQFTMDVDMYGMTYSSEMIFEMEMNAGVIPSPDQGGDEGNEGGENEGGNQGGTTIPEGPLTQADWENQLAESNFDNFVAGINSNGSLGKEIYNRDGENEQYEMHYYEDNSIYGILVYQMGDSTAYFTKDIDSDQYVEGDPVYIRGFFAEVRGELIFLATLAREYFYLASYDAENGVYRIQLSNVSRSVVIGGSSYTFKIDSAEYCLRLENGEIYEISVTWSGSISEGQFGTFINREFSILLGEGYVEAPELEGATEMPPFELEIPVVGNEVSEEVWKGEMVEENFDNFAAMLVEGTTDEWTGLYFERSGEDMYQSDFYNGVLQKELLAEKLISSVCYYYDNQNGYGYQTDSTTETQSLLEESSYYFTMLSLAMVDEYSNLSYDAELGAYTLFVEYIPMGGDASYTVTLENVTYYFVFVGDKLASIAMNGELIVTVVNGTNTTSQESTMWYQLMMDYAELGIPEFTPDVPAGGEEIDPAVWDGQLGADQFVNFTATGVTASTREVVEVNIECDGENIYEKNSYPDGTVEEYLAYNDGNGVVYYQSMNGAEYQVDDEGMVQSSLASSQNLLIMMAQCACGEWENAVYDENTGAYTLTLADKPIMSEGGISYTALTAIYTLVFEEGELVYMAMEMDASFKYYGTVIGYAYMGFEITFDTGSVSAPEINGGNVGNDGGIQLPEVEFNTMG